jgi:transposase
MKAEQDQHHRDGRGRYTQQFKRSVVDRLLSSGKSVRQVGEELGVNQWTLKEWKRKYGAVAAAPDAPMPATPEAMKQEIEQLRKELARVRLQRDILKKRFFTDFRETPAEGWNVPRRVHHPHKSGRPTHRNDPPLTWPLRIASLSTCKGCSVQF